MLDGRNGFYVLKASVLQSLVFLLLRGVMCPAVKAAAARSSRVHSELVKERPSDYRCIRTEKG